MKSKEIRIPKDDWGQFCWECYLRGFAIITGRMTEDGEVIVTSGVPKLKAEEFAENIRFATELREQDGSRRPTYDARVLKEKELDFAEGRLDPYIYHNGTRFRRVRVKREVKKGKLLCRDDLEVIEDETEDGSDRGHES